MQARNVFGAVSLALADEILHDTTLHAPEAGPAGSALALIGHRPGLSIRTLAESVALTHAGAVRLVDRLESEGLIERRTHATDGRTRALYLTEAGEKASSSVLQARDSVLERGFAALRTCSRSPEQHRQERQVDELQAGVEPSFAVFP